MTIAMCYLSPEGIVLGADSTASLTYPDGSFHYFNHAQKLFQVGATGSLGMLTWGLGGIGELSYRTLIAALADQLEASPAANVAEVAARWAALFWFHYEEQLRPLLNRVQSLHLKPAWTPSATDPSARTEAEEKEYLGLSHNLVVGFCIAGSVLPGRAPTAFQIVFEPSLTGPPAPQQVFGAPFWGAPNMIQRLIIGADPNLRSAILSSGYWTGGDTALDAIMDQQRLVPAILPIRDAIDFVHTCIYSTIKALKFSSLQQICGGPIEIAVITTDREFRWVRHKSFDAAISEGERP